MNSKKKLKAILLSAGIGSRLMPLTKDKPKCLMRIGNKPLLGIWLDKLKDLGCTDVLINTHYHAEQVNEFLNHYKSKSIKINVVHEEVLMGTAGTLLKNKNFVDDNTLLIHADNFTSCNLKGLIKAHNKKNKTCLITMLTFTTNKPSSCGVVLVDSKGIVEEFHEKVKNPPSNLANGAIYVIDKDFISWLVSKKNNPFDFSNDVLPHLTGKIQTWLTDEFFIDIGTPDSLKTAQKNF
tara:strand:+ start:1055 stop:1765 length:711 start_codon:yes stop_codon:yes gene_type:complete